jgi:hypothetical protein
MTQVPEGLNDDIEEPVLGRLERDPSAAGGPDDAVEDSADYERAVEEDTVLAPDGDAGPADDERPTFQEPGEEPR